jgi:hypothetical protein
MRETVFPRTRSLTKRGIWEEISKALGVRLEGADRAWSTGPNVLLRGEVCARSEIRAYEDRYSLLEVAKDRMKWGTQVMILEEDRIRVLQEKDALPLWIRWWEGEQKKEK